MKIVLHIGAWKTGSSAIQRFLRRNLKKLAARGVIIPPLVKESDGHQKIYEALSFGDDAAAAPILAQLTELAAAHPDGAAVISSEHYWPLSLPEVQRVAKRLKSVTSDVSVLLYVRPQEELWASLFAQEAKFFRVTSKTPKWGTHDYIGPNMTDRAIYFDKCLGVFRDVFGEGSVFARAYMRDAFVGGDVIRDFLSFLGVTDTKGLNFDGFDRNPSLGWKGVAFSIWFAETLYQQIWDGTEAGERAINEAFTMSYSQTKKRFRDRDWVGKAPVPFSDAERAEIRAHYSDDNQALFDRFFSGENVFGDIRSQQETPLDAAQIPPNQWRFAAGRLYLNLKLEGVDASKIEDALVPRRMQRAILDLMEKSPYARLGRMTREELWRD